MSLTATLMSGDLAYSNFAMRCGDDQTLEVTTLDEDDAVVDIAGFTITFNAYISVLGVVAAIITKSIGSGITVIDAANGRFDIQLDSADTSTVDPKKYYHETELVDGVGTSRTGMIGDLVLRPARKK